MYQMVIATVTEPGGWQDWQARNRGVLDYAQISLNADREDVIAWAYDIAASDPDVYSVMAYVQVSGARRTSQMPLEFGFDTRGGRHYGNDQRWPRPRFLEGDSWIPESARQFAESLRA